MCNSEEVSGTQFHLTPNFSRATVMKDHSECAVKRRSSCDAARSCSMGLRPSNFTSVLAKSSVRPTTSSSWMAYAAPRTVAAQNRQRRKIDVRMVPLFFPVICAPHRKFRQRSLRNLGIIHLGKPIAWATCSIPSRISMAILMLRRSDDDCMLLR